MRKLWTSALAIAASFSGLAAAQDDDTGDFNEVVVVTVQKREQALQDVPINVTAFNQRLLDQIGADEFEALAAFVPGFEVQEQSPNNPGFVVRGITSDSGEATIEPRVSVFVDGVDISRSRGSIVELFDLERVEVAKGPQSTLLGRGALIGAINIIQAKARFENEGRVTLGFGNFGEFFAEGVANRAFGETFAVRGALRIKSRDGYVESLNPAEEDFNSTDMKALRLAARWEPSEALRFDLIANFQRDTPSGTSFKSSIFAPVGGNLQPWSPANLNTFGGVEGGAPLGLDREVYGATLIGEWRINNAFSLTSITAGRRFDSTEIFDPDGFDLPVLAFAEVAKGETWSQELRVNFDLGDRVTGFAGASYFDETGTQRVPLFYDERTTQFLLTYGNPTSRRLAAPFLVGPGFAPLSAFPSINVIAPGTPLANAPLKPIHQEQYTNFGDTQALDLYADVTVAITDRLDVSAGVRYSEDEKSTGALPELLNGGSRLTGGGIFVNTASAAAARGRPVFRDLSSERTTWRVVGKYDLSEAWNVWGSFGRGARPEILTPAFGSITFNLFPSEEVESYEVGSKAALFGGALTLDGSVFRFDYTNFQATVRDPATGALRPFNAGNASSEGFEGQAFWSPTPLFAGFVTYGFNEARFDDTDDAGRPQQFAGNQFRLSPDHTAAVGARFTFDWAGVGAFSVAPSYSWQSKVFFNDDNDRPTLDFVDAIAESQDAYGLLNLRVRLEDAENRWALEAYAENLLDEEYIIDAGNTGGAFGIPTLIAGTPRFYGLRITGSF
jgi:outer membrane receptor protein involved in Fe transport